MNKVVIRATAVDELFASAKDLALLVRSRFITASLDGNLNCQRQVVSDCVGRTVGSHRASLSQA